MRHWFARAARGSRHFVTETRTWTGNDMGDIWHCAGGGFAGLAVCKMERRTEKKETMC